MAAVFEPLFIGEDMAPTWTGARAAGQWLNTATVTWTLKRADTGATLDTGTCTYQSGSNGNYVGSLDSATTDSLTEGSFYFLDFALVQSGNNGFRRLNCRAQYRRDQ